MNKYNSVIQTLRSSGDLRPVFPVSKAQIDEIEQQIGYPLPSDYREFLSDYSGLRFPYTFFPISENVDGEEQGEISGFYSSTEEYPLSKFYLDRRDDYEEPDPEEEFDWRPGLRKIREIEGERVTEEGWPKELLPIGYSSQLDEICIAISGLRLGAVFLWRANPIEGEQNLYLVANSFNEFMNSLFRSKE